MGRQLEQPRQGGAKRELAGTGMHGCFLGGWIYDRSWVLPIYRYPNCEAQLQQDQGRREVCFPTLPPNKILMWQVKRGEKTQVIIRGDHRFYRGSKLRQVEQAWRAAKAVVATLYKSRGGCLEAEEAVWMPWWHFCFWRPWRPWLASLGGRYVHIYMAGLWDRLELRASYWYDRLELRASCFLCSAGVLAGGSFDDWLGSWR